MRELTAEEIQMVSGGGFNFMNIVFSYSIGFVVGAISGIPLGPAGMLAGGLIYGADAFIVVLGEEVISGGLEGLNGRPAVEYDSF